MRVPGDHRHDVGRVAEARGHGAGIAQAERVDAAMAEPDGRVVPADERRDPRSLREAGLQERDALGLEFALERALDEAVQEHDARLVQLQHLVEWPFSLGGSRPEHLPEGLALVAVAGTDDGGGTVGEGLADDLQLVMRIALDHVARDGDRVERERGLPEVVDDVEEPRSRLLRAIQMGVAEVRDQRHELLLRADPLRAACRR
jgi:hypothetical protein